MSQYYTEALFDRIAQLEDCLRDLSRGASMCMPYFTGAAKDYMVEVKRTADAGLGYCVPTIPVAPVHLPSVKVIDEMFAKIMGSVTVDVGSVTDSIDVEQKT